jgi:hypothetical protein
MLKKGNQGRKWQITMTKNFYLQKDLRMSKNFTIFASGFDFQTHLPHLGYREWFEIVSRFLRDSFEIDSVKSYKSNQQV